VETSGDLALDWHGQGMLRSTSALESQNYQICSHGIASTVSNIKMSAKAPLLSRLEAESIYILREVAGQFRRPVLLYSIGKDSSVLVHLAKKAFYPAKPPFPVMHVDTTWKFREMIAFRDDVLPSYGMELIVHSNADGLARGINPFTHGSALHTEVMKTEALRQAMERHGFDAAIGGARRDEEKSRAKERIFSFRSATHQWDPKGQRPELWNLYNGMLHPGESMRVFPLSNWTELDVWRYIEAESIPVVPLYFAKRRPVVERDAMLIMVDDDRMPLRSDERPRMLEVRFRTLGCYPLTGAVLSQAKSVPEIINELVASRSSERKGRLIDQDQAGSMEKKKREGYF
jgi:sulfate adenylyltransferase subunit 2